jgi:hypothetical protein
MTYNDLINKLLKLSIEDRNKEFKIYSEVLDRDCTVEGLEIMKNGRFWWEFSSEDEEEIEDNSY